MYRIQHAGRIIYEGRYYNDGETTIAIVAVVTPHIDWAVYIGASNPEKEDDALIDVALHGEKLSYLDAMYYFGEQAPMRTMIYRE